MPRYTAAGIALFAAMLPLASSASAQQVSYEDLEATLGEPVTTSVTGKPQRASEAPAAITIITREEILRSPARDIPGLLKTYAGVDVNSWTAGQSDAAVRGGVQAYNPGLLVMVDGRQVYLDHYGMTDWNLIGVQLEEIQQVELVRGPASAIFGFNAASGVINIITRSSDKGRLDAVAEGGDHAYSRFSLSGATPIGDKLGIRFSAERAREGERAIPTYHFHPEGIFDSAARDTAAGAITARPGPLTEIDVNMGYAHNRELEYISSPTLGEVEYHTFTAGIRVTHDLGWGSVDGQLYSNWLKYQNILNSSVPGVTVSSPTKLDNNVVVAKTSLLARLAPDATLRVGGEFRSNRLSGEILYSPTVRYSVWSTNVMVDVFVTDRVDLTGAARIDHLALGQDGRPSAPVLIDPKLFDRNFTATSFNASMLVAIGRSGQLRINGGRGYQLPSLLAFGMHVVAQSDGVALPIVVSGNPSILPSEVWSAEIGYIQPIASALKVDADLFYSKANSVMPLPNQVAALEVGPTGAMAITSQFRNVNDITAYGAELSLAVKTGCWSGHANYAWVHTKDEGLSAENGVLYFLNAADASPVHKVNVDVRYDVGSWFATLVGRFTSKTRQLGALSMSGLVTPVDLPDTIALDAKGGFQIHKGVSVEIVGENLTKARGATGAPIWADRRFRAGLRVAL